MKYNFQKDKLYKIRFYDHCIGVKDAMECEVAGWCIDDNDLRVVLTHWIIRNDDKNMVEDNHEPVTIVKSCIISVRKLL